MRGVADQRQSIGDISAGETEFEREGAGAADEPQRAEPRREAPLQRRDELRLRRRA